jgi:hypothetical protein
LPRGSLPNFIVVGVRRAGTTTMFEALSAHPQVCSSATKETRYFQAVRYGEPLRPIGDYQAYFRRYSGEPITMECTPDYFYGGAATAQAIQEVCDPRVAIILREPLSRLISFYRLMHGRSQIPKDMTLQRYVERCQAVPDVDMNRRASNPYTGLWAGQYARFLPAWLEAFPGRPVRPARHRAHLCPHRRRHRGQLGRLPKPDRAARRRAGSKAFAATVPSISRALHRCDPYV